MAKNTYETKKCNEYMDTYGYPKLVINPLYEVKRNKYDKFLDQRGKDVGIFTGWHELFIDEKFQPENMDRKKKGKHLSVLRSVIHSGKKEWVAGVVTGNADEMFTDIWVIGIPKGKDIENIEAMEIYAVSCQKLRNKISELTGYSMRELKDIALELAKANVDTRYLSHGFRISRVKDDYEIYIPYWVLEEIGWHGWC